MESFREIAKELHVSRNTVSSVLQKFTSSVLKIQKELGAGQDEIADCIWDILNDRKKRKEKGSHYEKS